MSFFRKSEIEYRPWESDAWKSIFDAAELRLSRERVYTLVQYLNKMLLSEGDVIEMGVYRGCTAYVLGHFINIKCSKGATGEMGGRTIYLCDTFSGTPDKFDKSKGDINRKGKYTDTSVKYVEKKLSGCYDKVKCIEGFIPDSLVQIPNETVFCFAHIHLNLYRSTKDALLWLSNRMVLRGMVVVEDYGISNCEGVRNAVDELTNENIIDCIYIPTGQAIVQFKKDLL